MFNFFIGLLTGLIIMDILWAWKTGIVEHVVQTIRLKYKLWKANNL